MLKINDDNINYSQIKLYYLDKFNLSKNGIDNFLNFAKYLKDINFKGNAISQIIKLSNNDDLFDKFVSNYSKSEYYNEKLDDDNLEDLRYEFIKEGVKVKTVEKVKRVIMKGNITGLEQDFYFNR